MSEPFKPSKEKALPQLHDSGRLKGAEYDFTHHSVTAELGTSLDDVQRPEYFAHFAPKFRPYDEITVRVDDGTWYAKLLVLKVERARVHTKVIVKLPLTTAEVEEAMAADSPYKVTYRGPYAKFSVVSTKDNSVVRDKFDNKAEAMAWAATQA